VGGGGGERQQARPPHVEVRVGGKLAADRPGPRRPPAGPHAAVIWFTGLSGSGKSTIARRVHEALARRDLSVEYLDGDAIRGIFPTGFTKAERDAHIRRVGFVASLLEKHGVFVIASFVSPYAEAREFVRGLCRNFVEVYVSTPLDECERRDVKGLYARARRGEIQHFTGIDDPYEPPERPELTIDTRGVSVEDACAMVLERIDRLM
jgi:adenylylsulfate kinase